MRRAILFAFLITAPAYCGSIEGNVTNLATGAGIGGVQVTALKSLGAGAWAISGADGAFRIDELADGEYSVSTPGSAAATVKVAGETHFDLKLPAPATVRGKVLDPDGKEAEGIIVHLNRERSSALRAVTDEHGEFVIEDVQPGNYALRALDPEDGAKDGEKTIGGEYPERIDVAGGDISGLTIQLRKIAVRHVRGVVSPAVPAEVRLLKPSSEQALWVYGPFAVRRFPLDDEAFHLDASQDGAFDIEVPEGDWVLEASLKEPDSPGGSLTLRQGAKEIRVGRDDLENVKIFLADLIPIAVTSEWGDAKPSTHPKLSVTAPVRGTLGFPGRYWILPQTTPGFYLAAAMLDGRDVKGQLVEIDGPAEIHTTYKSDGGSVRGKAENGAGAAVALMADAGPGMRIGYSAKCDATGTFAIPEVAPGRYTIAAFRDPEEIRSGTFLDKLDAMGERVKVEAASPTTVELSVP